MPRRVRTVEIQAGITVKLPRGVRASARMLAEAVRFRIRNGTDPEGIKIDFLIWRRGAKEYEYKGRRLNDALLRAARLVSPGDWVFRQVRSLKGNGSSASDLL